MVEPYFNADQQALWDADLELVKSDVRHHFERIEKDSRTAGPK
jgi:hypothetical protein